MPNRKTSKQRIEDWEGIEPEFGSPAAKALRVESYAAFKRTGIKPEQLRNPRARAEYEAYLVAHHDGLASDLTIQDEDGGRYSRSVRYWSSSLSACSCRSVTRSASSEADAPDGEAIRGRRDGGEKGPRARGDRRRALHDSGRRRSSAEPPLTFRVDKSRLRR